MNSRKANETLYQNNTVELNDEALANVIGGCDESHGCHQDQDWNDCDGGHGHGGYHRRGCGLLGDLLGDLL